MALIPGSNVESAADPQAIVASPPRKKPIYDNDPTRDISLRQGVQRLFLTGLVAVALLAMLALTALVFVQR